MQYQTEIAIIGAGPVGLFTFFQAKMLNMEAILIEGMKQIGGQCSALYPQKPIYDIPASPAILAHDLISNLHTQIIPFSPFILLDNFVSSLKEESNLGYNFIIKTSNNNTVLAKSIIIACGGGKLIPNKPPLENIESFEGKSVFYTVTDKALFKNKNVVIAGGGDSALDWAIELATLAKKIYLVHRRNNFKGAPYSLEQINLLVKQSKIELVTPYQVHGLQGALGNLKYVTVSDLDNNTKIIEADFFLPFFGLTLDNKYLKKWSLNLTSDNSHIIVDNINMETNIKGIFGVGDIIDYPGKLKLILTGFAEAARACHSAYKFINPNKMMHFEYSTNKKIPLASSN